MKKAIFILILSFSFLSCSKKAKEKNVPLPANISTTKEVIKPKIKTETHSTTTDSEEMILEESFTDSTQIGIKGKNKLNVEKFSTNDSIYIIINLFEKRNNKWFGKQKLRFVNEIQNYDPQLKDFNNDGYKDLTFQSLEAARGANEIRKLLLYDKVKKEFVLMKNSDQYPNLEYNKLLNCLDSWMVSGGSSTVFLKIDKDSLREFARVSLLDNERKIFIVDKNGKEKILKKEFINDLEVYTRFKNYNPLVEDTNSE